MTATFGPVITGIVIMVPEARELTSHAHITLLAPFGRASRPTEGELGDVEAFFADVAPFSFQLSGVSTFPDGTRYLSPTPASVFSRLTHRLNRLFPEYPPYGGAFDLVIPHLTLPDGALSTLLPIEAHAQEAALLHFDGSFHVRARFPFSSSAA